MLSQSAEDLKRSTRIADMVPGLKRSGAYHVGPCPFCGGRDRFNVKTTDGGDLWLCRQCGDGKYHDALDFLQRSTGKSFAELVGKPLRPIGPIAPTAQPVKPVPVDLSVAPADDWQIPAIVAACQCADYLHGDTPDAAEARRYLQDVRKLMPATVRSHTIGFNPDWRTVGDGGRLAPGITIPCMVDGDLWYLQVRTTKAARQSGKLGKYHALTGSKLGALFNADRAIGARSIIVVEGEFDALVLSQNVAPEVAVVTMGSAGSLPGVSWLRYFAAARDIILMLDDDDAGRKALARWQKKLPRARAARLPDGSKDVSDFRRNGGNLVSWVADVLRV